MKVSSTNITSLCFILHVILMIVLPLYSLWTTKNFDHDLVQEILSCHRQRCDRKCCKSREYFESDSEKCIPKQNSSISEFFELTTKSCYDDENIIFSDFKVFEGNLCSTGKFILDTNDVCFSKEFNKFYHQSKMLTHTEFCVEESFSNGTPGTIFFSCFASDDILTESDVILFSVYPIGMISSCPFLILTFVVFLALKELHDIHGLAVMYHVFCLFVADISLCLVQLGRYSLHGFQYWCFTLGKKFTNYFKVLSLAKWKPSL